MFLLFLWGLYKVLSQICHFLINESRWLIKWILTKAFVFLLKSCCFSSHLSSCHCWSFLLHMKQNDKFFALKMNTFLRLSPVLMTLGLQKDVEACDCVHCGVRQPVKWDMATSIWAADLCTQDKWTLATTTFVRLIESNVHHLLDRSSFLLLMNGPVSWCITFWIFAHVLTQETLVFAKVARRKESETLMETVAKDNLRLL